MAFNLYGVSRNIGSQSFSSYLNSPVTGPLNSSQYPTAMPYHSYGVLTGLRPTPVQFGDPVDSNMNVIARRNYVASTSFTVQEKMEQDKLGKLSNPSVKTTYSSQRRFPVSSHVNYIKPIDSSSRIDILKSRAIGKSSYKIGLPVEAPSSTKSYDTNYVHSRLNRVRSSGSVAPKKKGSIFNTSLR